MATPPLVEDGYVPDVFVSGIARIERLSGGMARVVFYAERNSEDGPERVIVLKIVRPIATWPDAMRMLARSMGESDLPFVTEGGKIKPMDS